MHHRAALLMCTLALAAAPRPATAGPPDPMPASDAAPPDAAHARSAPAPTAATAPAPALRRVCTRERPTGSNRPVRVCRDAAQGEPTGEAAREALQRAQSNRYLPPEKDPS